MTESANTGGKVRLPEHVVFRKFAQETVVLDINAGRYYGLNAVGGRMLEELERLGDVDAVAEQVAAHYGTAIDRVKSDLATLVDRLVQRGLLEVEPRSPGG